MVQVPFIHLIRNVNGETTALFFAMCNIRNWLLILFDADKIPARFNVGIMLFMTCFVSYMLRVNISIIILGMIAPTNSSSEVPDVSRMRFTPFNR